MKSALTVVLFRLFTIGVFADGKETSNVESVSLMEGDSVTLKSGVTDMQTVDEIEWRFNGIRIEKFGDRLHLDAQTRDLKISNIRTTDSGLYKVKISSTDGSSEITFTVKAVSADAAKLVTVMEGDLVTLRTGLTEIQRDHVIRWTFGQQKSPVAEINRMAQIFNTSDGPDGRFRDRLQLDYWTGSLAIRNIRTTDAGLYEVDISSTSSRYTIHHTQSFNVTVREIGVSVMAGDSVTLHTGFPITQNKHAVLWSDNQDNLITRSTDMDPTRDLTIRNIRRDQSGNYKVNIINISSSTIVLHRIFHINIAGVFSREKDGVKTVSVVNGHSFTLHSNVTDLQDDVPIEWMFGPQNLFIAKTDGKSKNISYNDDVRFKNKVYLANRTGDLSIQDSSTEHSGLYQLKIINSAYTIQKSFSVTVSGLSPAAIAVIVVVLLVAAAVGVICYLCRYRCYYCCYSYYNRCYSCCCCKKSEREPKYSSGSEEDQGPPLLENGEIELDKKTVETENSSSL